MSAFAGGSAIWEGDPERLDRVITALGLTRSRTRAHELISSGSVTGDGDILTKPSTRIVAGMRLEVRVTDHYVSRGAHKLAAALTTFGIDPTGRVALDIGASTGGFTQVLLEHGAATVLAVDVGHEQMAAHIAAHPKVMNVEGCNARALTAEMLRDLTGITEQPTLAVADLSFISLTHILPALARTLPSGAEAVLLVKPQFEVGRVRHGIVTDPEQWAAAIRTVIHSATANGCTVRGLANSPIRGGEGNREFLLWIVHAEDHDQTEWEGRIRQLCDAEDLSPERGKEPA